MDRSKVLNIGRVLFVTIILSGALGWLLTPFSGQMKIDPKVAEERALVEVLWGRAERDRANAEPARHIDFIIAVAVIAAGLIVYIAWRGADDDKTLNTNSSQITAPENAPTTNQPAAAPENTQPSQQTPPQQ